MSTTSWSLNNSIHETMDHYLSTQHHGLFSLIPCMRPGTTLSVYNTMVSSHQLYAWDQEPLYLSIQHHGLFSPITYMRLGTTLCLFNTMVSSHQLYSWDQGPLYLSIQHHGLFSSIPCMRTGTTLSVYSTPWSLLTNYMHETRDHSICLYNIMVPVLMYGIGEKRP